MNLINQMKKNVLIKNTIILILTSLFIKVLSLVNRIIITRLLGNDGISLYVLILPTITLLSSLGGFSLNITISKIISENEVKKIASHKTILKEALRIGLYMTILTVTVFFFTIRLISVDLLKQPDSFYPLLFSSLIIPLVMINNVLRGYYNGLDKIEISAKANLCEQISRLLFSFILLYIFKNESIIVSVTLTVLAMAFGELISVIFSATKLKKYLKNYSTNTKIDEYMMFRLSLSSTLSHLIVNITFFLEPIIYTFALTKMMISTKETMYKYSEVNAYAIPLLTMFLFTSSAIATVIIPSISRNSQNKNAINKLTRIALKFALLPGIFIGVILSFYGNEYMYLLYNTSIGAKFVREYAFIFTLFYVQPILIGVLQGLGKQKQILKFSIIESVVKIILLYVLSIIPSITYKSLIYSIIIANILITVMLFTYLIKVTNLKFKYNIIIRLVLLFIMEYFTVFVLQSLSINFIIVSIIGFIIYFVFMKLLNLTSFHNE